MGCYEGLGIVYFLKTKHELTLLSMCTSQIVYEVFINIYAAIPVGQPFSPNRHYQN